MTKKALISEAELTRMAKVAKSQGVTVWIEIDGKRIGVSPDIQQLPPAEMQPEEFTSLEQWLAWRDKERARESARS